MRRAGLDLTIKLAAIGVIGIAAQWIAWRTGWPAIVLMLAGGIIAGPVTGFLDPVEDFGALYQPAIKLAVAVILFEGGLNLNFRELRHAGWAVGRLVVIAAPIAWVLSATALHYAAGLSWEPAILFGGILIVTGPTVIGPMLRQLRIGNRPRDILRWEGIVNDPIGALLAVLTLAYISYAAPAGGGTLGEIGLHVGLAALFAISIGVGLAFLLAHIYARGLVPEFLKTPLVFVAVISGFVLADNVEHETGLLTVTAMGITLANLHIESLGEMRRFKESISILLISGVFIILSAALDWSVLRLFEARFLPFLILLIFVIRPLSVHVAFLFSSVPWRERWFVAWIAPRGIVCVAITGLFALRLQELGYTDAASLTTLAFAVAIVTIVAHGFSAKWATRYLGLDKGPGRSILIVGATPWATEFAEALAKRDVPVTIADSSFLALRRARQRGIDTFHGEPLDAVHEDRIDLKGYQAVIAATDNDAYNALICAEIGPEIGRNIVFQTAAEREGVGGLPNALKGRTLTRSSASLLDLLARQERGWSFRQTRIGEKYSFDDLRKRMSEETEFIAAVKPSKTVSFFTDTGRPPVAEGDFVIAYVPPGGDAAEAEEHAARAERAKDARKEASGEADTIPASA